MDNAIQLILKDIGEGRNLTHDQSARAFQIIMNGGATPAQIGAFLMGLKLKGETPEEIAGGVMALRAKALRFKGQPGTLDTCGTGGDGRQTYNISTATAIVVAGCGVKVAKHGNRAVSSASGSADVLEFLGVKIDAPPELMEQALKECHLCFLYAPRYHTAMRHVAPVRQEIGLRTIFNLLGPLSNPAAPAFQLLGVFTPSLLEPMAQALKVVGTEHAWIVHGAGGEDELSLSGASQVVELRDGNIRRFEVRPEDAGLQIVPESELKGGSIDQNARALNDLLTGQKSAYRDAVLLNAAAALLIAGKAQDLREGAALAASAIDEGQAFMALQKLVNISRGQ